MRIISPIQARYEQAVGIEATRLFAPRPASAGTVARHAPELVTGITTGIRIPGRVQFLPYETVDESEKFFSDAVSGVSVELIQS